MAVSRYHDYPVGRAVHFLPTVGWCPVISQSTCAVHSLIHCSGSGNFRELTTGFPLPTDFLTPDESVFWQASLVNTCWICFCNPFYPLYNNPLSGSSDLDGLLRFWGDLRSLFLVTLLLGSIVVWSKSVQASQFFKDFFLFFLSFFKWRISYYFNQQGKCVKFLEKTLLPWKINWYVSLSL